METKVPYCRKHGCIFKLTNGMGGERYYECPKANDGGWNCLLEWIDLKL